MDRMHNRRSDIRLLCADLIELVWCDPSGVEHRRIANLEDISHKGMSLQLEVPVHVGTKVRVLYGKIELAGIVRYAVYRNKAYFIGVELDEDSRWSVRQFIPRHLLDPRRLIQKFLPKAEPAASRWVN